MSKDYKGMVHSRGIQPYVERGSPYADLDELFLDELSEDGSLVGLMGYSLDALDTIPSGSMWYDRLKPVMSIIDRPSK